MENRAEKSSGRKWRWRLIWLIAALLAITAGSAVWLTTSTSGLRSLGSAALHFSGGALSIDGLDGALSGSISAQTMRFASDDLLVIARDVRLSWQPAALRSGRLEIIALMAHEVDVVSPPSSEPKTLPASLALPVPLSLHQLNIGILRVMQEEGGIPDFTAAELTAQLESDGRSHRLSNLSASLDFGRLTASGRIDGTRPFDLNAQAELAGLNVAGLELPEMPGARISVAIDGSLEQLDVKAKGNGAGLTGEGEAYLRPYAPIVVAALRLSVNGLDPHVFSPDAPKASLALHADLHENAAGQLEGSVALENSASAPLDQGGLPLLKARAHPTLSAEVFQLNDLMLAVAGGGTVSGNLAWRLKEAAGSADLTVSRIDPVMLDTRLRTASLSGKAKLSGDAAHQQANVTLRDNALHMDISAARADNNVTLHKVHLRHGRSALTGHGKLGLTGQRPLVFESKLQGFDLSAFVQAPRTDLNATLDLAGELGRQAEGKAAGTVRFKMEKSRVAEQPASGNGRVKFSGLGGASGQASGQAEGEVELRLGVNRLTARGRFGRKGDQLQLDLAAPALAQIRQGFSGSVTAQATLENSFKKGDFEWPDVTVNATGHGLVFPGGHNLANFSVNGALHGDAIALTATAAQYGTEKTIHLRSLRLEVEGSRSRHELQTIARLDEDMDLTLRARGGLKEAPRKLRDWRQWQAAQWLGQLSELSVTGQLPFHLTSAAALEISSKNISLGATRLAVAGGNVKISGTEWSSLKWSSKGSFTGIKLRPGGGVVKGEGEEENRGALRLGGEWDISSGAQLTGSLNVAREGGDWVLPGNPPLPLGLHTLQFAAQAAEGRLTGELKAQGKHLGVANAGASVPIVKSGSSVIGWAVLPGASLAGQMSVNLDDISWIGPVVTDNLRLDGHLALQAEVIGTFGTPRLKGKIHGGDLALALLDQGIQLEQGKLAARFDQESLHMDVLDFNAPHQPPPADRLLKKPKLATEPGSERSSGVIGFLGGQSIPGFGSPHSSAAGDNALEKVELPTGPGSLRVSGTMNLVGGHGNLEITATRLPLAQRPDRWIIASGSGRASLEKNVLTLAGDLVADAGLIAQPAVGRPQLSDDIFVMGQTPPDRKGPRIDVDATLDLGKQFFIRASGLEGRLAGQLRVRGQPGHQLRTIGTIIARNANFEAYGQRLVVERGIVNFQGPIDDPGLNVLALRKGLPVEAGVEVTGSVRQPKIRLVSNPFVPDLEKLSWIALGRPPDGRTDASLLFSAAGAILGGQPGGVTDKITQALGVDELTVRQSGIGDPLMGQIGVVGKRLSDRAYISYEQYLTAAAALTKLTYSLTPKITVVTRAGIDNAIDLLYTMRFD